MITAVTVVSLALAILLFIAGVVDLVQSWRATSEAKAAVKTAAVAAKTVNASVDTLTAQSATDFKGAWEALAALAGALKDLDRSTRLLVLSLAFLAVSAVGAGVDRVADVVK